MLRDKIGKRHLSFALKRYLIVYIHERDRH